MIRTPDWWYKKDAKGAPWWRFVLWPLSLVWLFVNALKRRLAKPYRSDLFVISIGNLTLGGSGKTPIAAEVLRLLGPDAIGLSRGHGGTLDGPLLVDPNVHTAAQVGDEPLMLAQAHDFVVAKDRALGLKLIETSNARIAVVDDAHQNLKVAKDLHILVVDGDTSNEGWPFGDGGICPDGPMREPFKDGLARADLCVLWMPDETRLPAPELLALLAPKPVFVARLTATRPDHLAHVLGFAGIAKPWKFEATLRNLGYQVIDFKAFPDHASFKDADLKAMQATADAQLCDLFTTQKDWVRLDKNWRERVGYLPISARFDDEAGFKAVLRVATEKHILGV